MGLDDFNQRLQENGVEPSEDNPELHLPDPSTVTISTPPAQGFTVYKPVTYLPRLPKAVPEGALLVHNRVRPTRRLGSRGFRAWLANDLRAWLANDLRAWLANDLRAWLANDQEGLVPCDCDWAPELGPHLRSAQGLAL